jgi:predicted site-specific integrase-resolvase
MTHANDNEPDYMTAAELSARWKGTISPRTLANWRCTGNGPRFVKIGGRVMYRQSDVQAWENARSVTSTSQYARTAS